MCVNCETPCKAKQASKPKCKLYLTPDCSFMLNCPRSTTHLCLHTEPYFKLKGDNNMAPPKRTFRPKCRKWNKGNKLYMLGGIIAQVKNLQNHHKDYFLDIALKNLQLVESYLRDEEGV